MKKALIIISVVLLVIIAAVVSLFIVLSIRTQTSSKSLLNGTAFDQLKRQSATAVSVKRLAKNITPPTNKWFSGIALQETPKTVFPTPLAFTPTDTGFSYGLTGVEASANSVVATHRADVSFNIEGADHYLITRYDELSVDLTYYNAQDSSIATLTIASGVPYVFLQPSSNDVKLSTTQPFVADNNVLVHTVDGAMYGASGLQASGTSFTLSDKGGSLYAGSNQAQIDTLATYALNLVTGIKVEYSAEAKDYKTSLVISTKNNNDTVMGYLPHQNYKGETAFSLPTIYGSQSFATGKKFSFSTPTVAVDAGLNLGSLSSDQKTELITMLRREINATEFKAVDTYYSGKELYRSAQLLQLAQQLGQTQIATTIQQKLRNEFKIWFSPAASRTEKLFYYDTALKSVVGQKVSFGSEDDNDHHFHYGYFIYAASILAKYDKEFVAEYGDSVNLLVADIANYSTSEKLPQRRSFDAYFGHSWASGSAPFNDGNNQESSSEAINAWVGTSLWARVSNNTALETEASWMLSQEANAARYYWFQPVANADNYQHSITSLNWGGKRDYATFFSADPAAKLGILLLPLSPTMQAGTVFDRDAINSQLQESGDGSVSEVYNFQDYLLMYKALQNSEGALDAVRTMDDADIDGANSRSYMYAWVVSLSDK